MTPTLDAPPVNVAVGGVVPVTTVPLLRMEGAAETLDELVHVVTVITVVADVI